MKLSVIVPVFNGETSLEATLRSIRVQVFEDFEVIIVNDGSTDGTQKIIDWYCAADNRFKCYQQDNSGVSAARNLGLRHAKGEFVTFVDGDDLLPQKSFYYMAQITRIHKCDTIVGIYEKVDGATTSVNSRSFRLAKKAMRIQSDDIDMPHCWSLWNKWFSRQLIEDNEIWFEDFKHLEDGVFLYAYLQYATRIYTCPYVVYTYRKPLPFIGRTTTQSVSEVLLDNAESAFHRICELTAAYGEEFRQELVYRYIVNPLLGDYYRRNWQLTPECSDRLTKLINSYYADLDSVHRSRLGRQTFDIRSSCGVMSRAEILDSPQVAISVAPTFDTSYMGLFLESLYDQAEPSFIVYLPASSKDAVSEFYRRSDNLFFVDEPFSGSLDSGAKFIISVDKNVVFDHGTILSAVRKAYSDANLDCVMIPIGKQDREVRHDDCTDFFERPFQRLIRRELADACESENVSVSILDNNALLPLPLECSFVGTRLPTEDMEKQKAFTDDSRIKKRPSGLLNVFRKMFKPLSASATAQSSKPRTVASFYLNEDVECKTVLVEGAGAAPSTNALSLLQWFSTMEYGHFCLCYSINKEAEPEVRDTFAEHNLSFVKIVERGTQEYKRILFSVGYLFAECALPEWWIKKPGQVFVYMPGDPFTRETRIKKLDANALRNCIMADCLFLAEKSIVDEMTQNGTRSLMHGEVLTDGSIEELCSTAVLTSKSFVDGDYCSRDGDEITMIVSDRLEPSMETSLLKELANRGKLKGGVFLSFVETEIAFSGGATLFDNAVAFFPTAGKPINEWTERTRLYGDLPLKKVVIIDSIDSKRIRSFARFDAPSYLFITRRMIEIFGTEEDTELLRAVKSFANWGCGLYALDQEVLRQAEELLSVPVALIDGADAFVKEFMC